MLQEIRDICRIALEEGREPIIPDKWTCIPSQELLEMLFEDVKNENKYSISVKYTTGDSFDTFNREDEIPLLFSTLKEAQDFVATMFEVTAFADAGDSMFIDREALAEAKESRPWYNPRFDFVFMFKEQVVPHDPSGYLKELPVGIYEVSLTREMNPRFCLSKYEKTLYTPDKLYGEVEQNVETIKRRYLNRPESLGVLLTGAKGSGKTLIATLLSKFFIEMGKPVILVNSDWSERVNSLIPFLSVFKECLIIFDEFDKYYNQIDQVS